jgi:hypothetical protein
MERNISSSSNVFICPHCQGSGGYHHKGCKAGLVISPQIESTNCKCSHSKEAHGGTFPKAASGNGPCCMCECENYEKASVS